MIRCFSLSMIWLYLLSLSVIPSYYYDTLFTSKVACLPYKTAAVFFLVKAEWSVHRCDDRCRWQTVHCAWQTVPYNLARLSAQHLQYPSSKTGVVHLLCGNSCPDTPMSSSLLPTHLRTIFTFSLHRAKVASNASIHASSHSNR